MYSFILQVIFFTSLGVIVYLFSRAIPRVPDEDEAPHAAAGFDELLRKLPLSHIDTKINSFFERSLEKSRTGLMKFDGVLHRTLNRLKATNGKGNGMMKGGNIFKSDNDSSEE
jgi:hypothetical protein